MHNSPFMLLGGALRGTLPNPELNVGEISAALGAQAFAPRVPGGGVLLDPAGQTIFNRVFGAKAGSSLAGGGLKGAYPNPEVIAEDGSLQMANRMFAFRPGPGLAGGGLKGTYPNPEVVGEDCSLQLANRMFGSSYSRMPLSHAATHLVGGGDTIIDPRLLAGAELHINVFRSPLTSNQAFTLITNTAYWVFVGRMPLACTPKFVEFHVRSGGTGAQTAEIVIASTPAPPNKANQTLTKIEGTGTVDALTGTGVMRNTNAFSTLVAAGTYLWAGIRTQMASTQPGIIGLVLDRNQGYFLSTATPGALTGASSWTGAIIAANNAPTAQCPDLSVSLI